MTMSCDIKHTKSSTQATENINPNENNINWHNQVRVYHVFFYNTVVLSQNWQQCHSFQRIPELKKAATPVAIEVVDVTTISFNRDWPRLSGGSNGYRGDLSRWTELEAW